jgi:hypothetical protein
MNTATRSIRTSISRSCARTERPCQSTCMTGRRDGGANGCVASAEADCARILPSLELFFIWAASTGRRANAQTARQARHRHALRILPLGRVLSRSIADPAEAWKMRTCLFIPDTPRELVGVASILNLRIWRGELSASVATIKAARALLLLRSRCW